MNRYPKFDVLLGQTLTSIDGLCVGSEQVVFTTADGKTYVMHHEQDCYESVDIEDICGNVEDLLNTPILLAEENGSDMQEPEAHARGKYDDSETWTFYRLTTIKGSVVIRWYGCSNGYYSETPRFVERG